MVVQTSWQGLKRANYLENLKTCCIDVKHVKKVHKEVWLPPSVEDLKFNVDGSVRRELERAGIGGFFAIR